MQALGKCYNGAVIISVIGPSGSGKGTQAKILADKLGIPSVSLGELMREEKEAGTKLGLKLATYTDQGKFVPSNLLAEILATRLDNPDCRKGFILDGTPRKIEDIALMDKVLDPHHQQIDLVVHLDTLEETTLSRIQQRIYATLEKGKKVRDDEALEAVKVRLAEYNLRIADILDYYSKRGELARVDNEGPVEEVSEAVWQAVSSKLNL